ncbi:hypothetical protein IWQ62_002760 [Dispira parvispora]|uniref:Uncharacterized protein n=1 Tax=Dispira parvispora TaxID=1520584 RepID=A0A9W8APQ6_9FUNG|nr:hypothetical protein IWQ62_002760 [Dispira parvispora]
MHYRITHSLRWTKLRQVSYHRSSQPLCTGAFPNRSVLLQNGARLCWSPRGRLGRWTHALDGRSVLNQPVSPRFNHTSPPPGESVLDNFLTRLQTHPKDDASRESIWEAYISLRESPKGLARVSMEQLRRLLRVAIPNLDDFPTIFSLANQGTLGVDDPTSEFLQQAEQRILKLQLLTDDLLSLASTEPANTTNDNMSVGYDASLKQLSAVDFEHLIGGFLQYGQFSVAYDLVEHSLRLGLPLTPLAIQYFVFSLVATGRVLEAMNIVNEIKTVPHQRLTLATFQTLLHGAIYTPVAEAPDPEEMGGTTTHEEQSQDGPTVRARYLVEILDAMEKQGYPVNQTLYNDILSGLLLRHPTDQDGVIFCSLTRTNVHGVPKDYSRDTVDDQSDQFGSITENDPQVEDHTARESEPETAVEFYHFVQGRPHWQPDAITYQLVIQGYTLVDQAMKAWAVFQEYCHFNRNVDIPVEIVRTLIDEAVSIRQDRMVDTLFQRIRDLELQVVGVTHTLFAAFVKAYVYLNAPDKVKVLWADVVYHSQLAHEDTGTDRVAPLPNDRGGNSLSPPKEISAHGSDHAAVTMLTQKRVFQYPQLTNELLSVMIEFCGQLEDKNFLQAVLDQASQLQATLTEDHFNLLVVTYCQLGLIDKALDTLQGDVARHPWKPSLGTLRAVHQYLTTKGLTDTKRAFVQWVDVHYPDYTKLLDQEEASCDFTPDEHLLELFERNHELLKDLEFKEFGPKAPIAKETIDHPTPP